jgi:hypothetical protein
VWGKGRKKKKNKIRTKKYLYPSFNVEKNYFVSCHATKCTVNNKSRYTLVVRYSANAFEMNALISQRSKFIV